MSELMKIGADLAQKLGLKVLFYAENTRVDGVPVCEQPFETCTDDGQYTYFRFLYKGVGYIGVLEGAGEEEKRYAMLLPSYLESFVERETELSKTAQLKRILLGESSSMALYKYMTKYSVRDTACFVIALRVDKYMKEALGVLEQYGGNSLDTAIQMSD